MSAFQAAAAAALAIGLVAVSGAASAQLSPSSSKGPIDIAADQAEVQNDKCLTIWRGAAEVLQGQARLRANEIRAIAHPKGTDANGQTSCGDTDRLEADGDVYYVTPTQIAHGQHAVYTAADDTIVFTGDVIVVQGKDVVRGDRLVIHVGNHEATMDSDAKGAGHTGRAQGVFYPNQPGSPTLAAPGAPAPK